MARKKVMVVRQKLKPMKKKRNLSPEAREKLRQRMLEMHKKRKPAEYKNISKMVLALPDDDTYSFKNVKEWIRESKDQVAAFGKTARSMSTTPQEKQKASIMVDSKKAYIRYCEHYLKHGDWIGMFSGKYEEHKVIPRCVAMAYYPDGTPKRDVGVYYPDIDMVWTTGMDESEYAFLRDDVSKKVPLESITDKAFRDNQSKLVK